MFEMWFSRIYTAPVKFALSTCSFLSVTAAWLCILVVHTSQVQQHMENSNVICRILLCQLQKKRSLHVIVALEIVVAFIVHAVHDWRSVVCAEKRDAATATTGAVRKLLVVV